MRPDGDFAWALGRLQHGDRVARRGWNGKGMWICLQLDLGQEDRLRQYVLKLLAERAAGQHDHEGVPINANTAKATGLPEGSIHRFDRYLMMRTVSGSFVPWLASQTDILATDWESAP